MFIRWQSVEGQGYRVEYKEALTDPDWVPLGIDILGSESVMAGRVPPAVYPQRFYRLRAGNDVLCSYEAGTAGTSN